MLLPWDALKIQKQVNPKSIAGMSFFEIIKKESKFFNSHRIMPSLLIILELGTLYRGATVTALRNVKGFVI